MLTLKTPQYQLSIIAETSVGPGSHVLPSGLVACMVCTIPIAGVVRGVRGLPIENTWHA